eukprot:COSAG05_NODE_761_length_7487_cov_150.318760_4_plen_477_part_00
MVQTTMAVPYFKKFEKDKKVLGMLQPGQMISVMDKKMDKKGKPKVMHQLGWTPLMAPDGRLTMLPPAEEGEPPVQQPQEHPQPQAPQQIAPTANVEAPHTSGPPQEDERGELVYPLTKGAKGFGINIDLRGVVTGFSYPGSPAEVAGVPTGVLVVRVQGVPVLGKPEVIAQLQATAAQGLTTVDFAFMTPQSYMARKQAQDAAAAAATAAPEPADNEPRVQDVNELPSDSMYGADPGASADPAAVVPGEEPAASQVDDSAAAPAAALADIPDLGALDGGMDFMASIEAIEAPAPVEVPPERQAGIGVGRRKKKKRRASVEGVAVPPSPSAGADDGSSPADGPATAPAGSLQVDPQEQARLEAERAEAEAAAAAEAEARAQYEAELAAAKEAQRQEDERRAAEAAARAAAEEEARRLAEAAVTFRLAKAAKELAGFHTQQAQLLQQIARQRTGLSSDENKIRDLEIEIETSLVCARA